MKYKKVGVVVHFYDKIGVAIVELSQELKRGDNVVFMRGGEELFEQKVESIEKEHKAIERAGKGDSVGIKLSQPVRAQTELHRIVDESKKK